MWPKIVVDISLKIMRVYFNSSQRMRPLYKFCVVYWCEENTGPFSQLFTFAEKKRSCLLFLCRRGKYYREMVVWERENVVYCKCWSLWLLLGFK